MDHSLGSMAGWLRAVLSFKPFANTAAARPFQMGELSLGGLELLLQKLHFHVRFHSLHFPHHSRRFQSE
jgi:hypothetical protein